jgi:hypothetical protein
MTYQKRDNQSKMQSKSSDTLSSKAQGGSGKQGGDHATRVQAGKKAAETRGHESLSKAGQKGGQHSHGGGRKEESGEKGSK